MDDASPRGPKCPDRPASPASPDNPASPDGPDNPDAGLTFEQARGHLEEVVRTLEAGGVPLEESLALWERAEALAALCQAKLDGARTRLDSVTGAADAHRQDPSG